MRAVKYPHADICSFLAAAVSFFFFFFWCPKSHAPDCPVLFIGIIYHVMASIDEMTNVSLRSVTKKKILKNSRGNADQWTKKETVSVAWIKQISLENIFQINRSGLLRPFVLKTTHTQ